MTNPTLRDFQSELTEGDREDKSKGMGGPQGVPSPTSPSMPAIKVAERGFSNFLEREWGK
ncbi:MAG: hypothetical protein QXU98_13005 [Candidatus Parvarchaeota archaeon]